MQKTIDFAVRINSDLPMFGIMTPYPGTQVAKLAAEGKGGYKSVSLDWDQYRKQIGSSLEFANISRREIEFYQTWGYIKVFLWNFRFLDFLKFLFEFRFGAWNLLKKIIFNSNNISLKKNTPIDYDLIINKGKKFQLSDFVNSKTNWEKYQKDDIARISEARKSTVKN